MISTREEPAPFIVDGRLNTLAAMDDHFAMISGCSRTISRRFAAHAVDRLSLGAPVVLVGDYNFMPTDPKIYAPER